MSCGFGPREPERMSLVLALGWILFALAGLLIQRLAEAPADALRLRGRLGPGPAVRS